MTLSYIDLLSFEDKLQKLEAGIYIPPPTRTSEIRSLDVEFVRLIAMQFDSRIAFQRGDKSAYNWALRNGVMDDICNHMERPKRGESDEGC